jgi:predicted ATPase/SAM-dependent methyltransferase
MKIAKFAIDKKQTDAIGLHEISLTKKPLGSVVALIGKNGAGKTRILNLVKEYIQHVSGEQVLEGYISDIPERTFGDRKNLWGIAKAAYLKFKQKGEQTAYQNAISNINSILEKFRVLGKSYIKTIDNDEIKTIKDALENGLTFESILRNEHHGFFQKNGDLNKNEIVQVSVNEFSVLNSANTIDYLRKLTTQLATEEFDIIRNNRKNLEKIDELLKEKNSHKFFTAFQGYVRHFLGKEFNYETHTNAGNIKCTLTFNGKPIQFSYLSPGQKLLFAYSVLLLFLEINANSHLSECILIMDEPEKHLHPEAQMLLIDALRGIVSTKGQLWIATHSINILSHLNADEILMVQDDAIVPPSRITPGKSFVELMGIEEHITELSAFITSLSEWAYGNFMRQCFENPHAILVNDTKDPQFLLFKEKVETMDSIKVLDYGAGKGRIGFTIAEDETLRNKIQYYAFEPSQINFEFISSVPELKEAYSKTSEISTDSFDFVLLCNVLHEIHPRDWISTLNEVKRILKPSGCLLFLEDKYLPHGETAHSLGYLILRPNQLTVLFNTRKVLSFNLIDDRYKERLIFCAISKEDISVNELQLLSCIENLESEVFLEIKKLRPELNNKNDVSLGRKYANLTQLYVNARMAIEEFRLTT